MILEKNEILKLKKLDKPKIGIYFLMDKSEVVYIGQSINIDLRIAQHKRTDKEFDRTLYLECGAKELDLLEAAHIQEYQPRYNKVNNFLIGFEKIKDRLKKETGNYSEKFYQKNLKAIAKRIGVDIYLQFGKIKIKPVDAKKIMDIAIKEADL